MTVAWASEGNLFLWTPADSEPRQIAADSIYRPYLSPNVQQVAFIRRETGQSDTLWMVDSAANGETRLVDLAGLMPDITDQLLFWQVAWLDETTLVFNTLRQTAISADGQNDLYRVDVNSGEVTSILSVGEGGSFSFSPSRTAVVVMQPGVYGEAEGRIRFVDLIGASEPRDLLTFPAVATGSHERFYPTPQWLNDETALVAIPDADAIYNDASDGAPPVALWRLNINGEGEQIGEVQASVFALPTWSDDGVWMTYLRREGTSNNFTLYVASGDGSNLQRYDGNAVGTIFAGSWLPDEHRFLYPKDDAYWFGSPGEDSPTLERWISLNPTFNLPPRIVGEFAIYPFFNGQTIELRYANIHAVADESILIATMPAAPLFDATIQTP